LQDKNSFIVMWSNTRNW